MGEDAASGKRRDLGAMLKGSGMTKVARIDIGLLFEPGFELKVDGFAQKFGLLRIELQGKAKLAKGSYESAKSRLLAQLGSTSLEARTRSPHSWGLLEPIQAICRMTLKKFLGE